MRKITVSFGVVALLALIQVVFPNAAFRVFELVTASEHATATDDIAPLLPKIADKDKPGFPHVNYDDATAAVRAEANSTNANSIAGAAADFDSDGVQDLATVDAGGRITLFKGNADTIYPNSPEAKLRRAENGEATAFLRAQPDQNLPVSPNFFSAGDFNADGRADILAAVRGTNIIYLAVGNGDGRFSTVRAIPLEGVITALETGEIGRPDGQTDIAVAYVNKGKSFVAVYEHPEGAFAHKPEIFSLPTAANALAIGNLDKDVYGDVAAGGGAQLTLIHGRGQAYPLDLKADLDIQRPAAFVQSKQMPFSIADLAIGRFGNQRGESIAVLSFDGRISVLEPQQDQVVVNMSKRSSDAIRPAAGTSMRPASADTGNYGVIKNDAPKTEAEADAQGQVMADSSAIKENRLKVFDDKFAALQKERAKLTQDQQAKKLGDDIQKTVETTARRKETFEASLAPKPVPFSNFKIETIAADPAIAVAVSHGGNRLVKGRFSDSGLDDLAVVDAAASSIRIIGKWNDSESRLKGKANIVSINSAPGVTTILPMRLNSDALSDLVMLGAGAPSVIMSMPAFALTVNSTDDTGGDCVTPNSLCTLRRAIFVASNFNLGGTTLITFDIPGSGVHTIHPTSSFEDIRQTTTIDGTTQPGFVGSPLIEIEGDLMTGAQQGIQIRASNSVVRGLVINHFSSFEDDNGSQIAGSGLTILSTSQSPNVNNVIVEGNYIGTDPSGSTAKGNDANGVHIFDADANTIGGTTAAARNILSGNGNYAAGKTGVGLAITGGNNNLIHGNYIGTNALGNMKVGNSYGVFFTGINNQFGGDAFGEGNVVSGNGGPPNQYGTCYGGGIAMFGLISLDDGSIQTDSNFLKGNMIGTNASGIGPLGNCSVGVSSPADINTTIGSITQNGRNIIADNGWDALYCGYSGDTTYGISGGCSIIGNNIGTDITGSVAMPNDQRNNSCIGFCIITDTVWVTPPDLAFVVVGAPGGTTPGGACTGMCNLISGNLNPNSFGGGGLYRSGYGLVFAVDNYIGVNRSGSSALPNFGGFQGYYGDFVFGAELSDGNGGTIAAGNVSSGNDQYGVSATALTVGGVYEIRGNLIGLSSDGISSIGNGIGGSSSCGICARSQGGTSTAIGGITDLQRNYVAAQTSDSTGTRGDGLSIYTANGASTTVFNNWIGMNKQGNLAGNSGNGIAASGDGKTRIGGLSYNEYNFIVGNGGAGVVVTQFTGFGGSVTPAENVTIRGNPIAINGGLGIDLINASLGAPTPSGVTPNDCGDEDDGANGFQNFPVLFPPVFNGNGTVSVPTTLRSIPARQYVIDYYQSPAADPSNYGEGSNYIGSIAVQTDGNGFAGFTFTSPNPIIPTQTTITATATDVFGNTSEFSCAAGVCETGSFQRAIERPEELTCAAPIIVTVDTNEDDANTADGVCDVDLNTPDLQCSLRAAIQEANARLGFNSINFNIPGPGVHTISIPTAMRLPHITEKATIVGESQPGYNGTPLIEVSGIIEGNLLPGQGFVIETSKVDISGLAINRFAGAIFIGGPGFTTNDDDVYNCYIGMHPDGSVDALAGQYGIAVSGSATDCNIGFPYRGNVIANSVVGIQLAGTAVQNNTVANNKIGTDVAGTTAKGNFGGVLIGSGAHDNLIGGELDSEGNVISGNAVSGISIGTDAKNNKVQGNYIGTRADGEFALPNGVAGIELKTRANGNTIGGPTGYQNIISGNGGIADPNAGWQMSMDETTFNNKVFGNNIGMKKSGTAGLGGIVGIGIAGSNNTLGGEINLPNVIGSQKIGVFVQPSGVSSARNNIISYNRIGIDLNQSTIASNLVGIQLDGSVISSTIANNVISGNQGIGIFLGNGPSNNTVSANKIGTDANGSTAKPNGAGIVLVKSSGNFVKANTISGNTFFGVFMGEDFTQNTPILREANEFLRTISRPDGSTPTYTSSNTVQGNRIGTDSAGQIAVPNGYDGVQVGENARDNLIGGKRSSAEGNYIAGHTLQGPKAGVFIGSIFVDPTDSRLPKNNKIQGNYIGWGVGFTPISNDTGIYINGAANNLIGADPLCQAPDCNESDYGNYIGNSLSSGITFEGEGTIDNNVRGNRLGIDNTFTINGLNASDGIYYKATNHNTIEDNVIAGSGRDGVRVEGHRSFTLEDNDIAGNGGNGITVADTGIPRRGGQRPEGGGFLAKVLGNSLGKIDIGGAAINAINSIHGIELINTTNTLVGSSPSGRRTVVVKSGGDGIKVSGGNTFNTEIGNATVGTDATGSTGVGNGGDGIHIDGAPNVLIGGAGQGNIVSGNTGNGISVENTSNTSIKANSVGVVPQQGNVRLANQKNGISIRNSQNSVVGGTFAGIGNVVSGNLKNGVLISGVNSISNQIQRNALGTDLFNTTGLGNNENGVRVTNGAHYNVIGGDIPDNGNTISGNGGNGIQIDDENENTPFGAVTQSSNNNRVAVNTIFNNIGLGIDIFPAGANPNDAGDGDEGPNRSQNYPVIDNFIIDSNGNLIASYMLDTNASNANYGANGVYVQFFKSDSAGQGQSLLNSDYWTTADQTSGSLKGVILGNAAALGFTLNDLMTATATDADGNTSEFVPTGVIPTPSPTPNSCLFGNGGFESGSFGPWTIANSEPTPVVSSAQKHSGNFSVFLGSPTASETPGDSSIFQVVAVPSGGGTLSFWYRPETTDSIDYVWQDAYVTDAAGTNILVTLLHVASNSQTWTRVTYDMSAFAGTTVAIRFLVHGDGFGLFTNMYVDDVCISSTSTSTPTATPTNTSTPSPVINGTVTYGNAIGAPAQRFVSNALISAAGSTVSMSTFTGTDGAYSLSGFDSGSYTITPSKTGGQDNAISSFDAALIAQHVVGPPFPHLSGNQLLVADVSGNGNISSFDAAEVAHYVVANSPTGNSGNWIFNPASNFHATVNSSIAGEDYAALLMGEVSGNWGGSGSRRVSGPERGIEVSAPQLAAESHSNLVIPIRVQGATDKGIISYEFNLRYDPLVIRPQTNPIDLVGTISRDLTTDVNAQTPGLLKVAVYGPMPINRDGILLNLRFTTVGAPGLASSLVWERIMFNEGGPIVQAADGNIEVLSSLQ